MAQAYGVNKAGTILALDGDGRELARLTGKPAETPKFVDDALAKNTRSIIWRETLAEAKQKADAERKPIVALIKVERAATMTLTDGDGKELGRAEGKKTARDLKPLFEKAIKGRK